MSLRTDIIKLATDHPELRVHLLPLLKQAMEFDTPEAMQSYLKAHPGADKSNHTVKKAPEKHQFKVMPAQRSTDVGESIRKDLESSGAPLGKGEAMDHAITMADRIRNGEPVTKEQVQKAMQDLDDVIAGLEEDHSDANMLKHLNKAYMSFKRWVH